MTLLPPVGEITSLNKAEDCIFKLFKEHDAYDDFPIDENSTSEKSTISFKLEPLNGKGSLTFEFTDIPGEWCSNPPQQGGAPDNHMEEVKQLMKYVADHHDNLYGTLTDKQKEILEKFDDCQAELTDINEREIFVYAFRLGMRIAIEVLLPDSDSIIR